MTRIYFVCSAIASGAIRAKTNPNRLTYLYHFLLFFCLDTKETKNQALFSFPENSKNEFSYRDPSRSSFLVVYDGRSLHPALKFIPRVFAENEKGRSDEFGKFCVLFFKSGTASQRFRLSALPRVEFGVSLFSI